MTHHTSSIIPIWAGLRGNIDAYDLIICDLWGVMHDGISLHTPAQDALIEARRAGVQTVFLSNAPRPRAYVREHLAAMGMAPELLDNVVTSGGLARDYVRAHFSGGALYHMGPRTDSGTVAGLPVTLTTKLEDADAILATDLDRGSLDDHRTLLAGAAERQVPFLCANPDRVVHVGSKLYACAGAVADIYAGMGGPVVWFGKPVASAFMACRREIGLEDCAPADVPEKILMIGDSMQTDIAGAVAAGLDSVLITGGIHRAHLAGHFASSPASPAAGVMTRAAFLEVVPQPEQSANGHAGTHSAAKALTQRAEETKADTAVKSGSITGTKTGTNPETNTGTNTGADTGAEPPLVVPSALMQALAW